MISYTGRNTLIQDLANTSDSTVLTNLHTIMNQYDKTLMAKKPWWFLEREMTSTSTANQTSLALPATIGKVLGVTLTSGTHKKPMNQVNSRREWDVLTQTSGVYATYPTHFFVFNDTIQFFPGISTASLTITVQYLRRQKDIGIADYTTGTISAVTNGDGTITGGSTSWTAKMAGRFIRITDSYTANTGDGEWYEIASYTSATELELQGTYQGISIAAGSAAYIIADVSLYPEAYQMLPLYHGLVHYFTSENEQPGRANMYQTLKTELLTQMEDEQKARTTSVRVNTRQPLTFNPNLYPHQT